MGDISEKGASGSTKIVGSDSSGNETNYVDVTPEGEIKVSSFANLSFVTANKTVSTTEIIANATGTNLSNRKSIIILNRGAQDIFYGVTGVNDTTGIPITKDEVVSLSVGDNVDVYLVTKSGNATVTIQEFA